MSFSRHSWRGAHTAPFGLFLAFSLLAGSGFSLLGCERGEPSGAGDRSAASTRIYTVRGAVRQLPGSGGPGVPLLIQHEAIPDFLGADGTSSAMATMTMPFAVADSADLENLQVGDKVVFELMVDWQAGAAMLITSIDRLPPETVLDLEMD